MSFGSHVIEENNVEWVNYHKNTKVQRAKRLTIKNEKPTKPTLAGMRATAARIQDVISQGVAVGVRLHACGARWSFSDIPVVKNGWMIETTRLDWTFAVSANDLEQTSRIPPEEVYLVQCGTKISKINERLESRTKRRALRTSGASNGQTIAGALGTGVHGSAIDVGGMESQVVGIQILTSDKNLWVEPGREPVMTANFAAKLGATLVRDDALFDAALVSLGALGIIHSVMIRSTGRYLLNSSLSHIPKGKLEKALNSFDFRDSGIPDETRRPYFFQVIFDPHKMDIGYTTVRYKELCPPSYAPDYRLKSASEPGTDLPRLVGTAIDTFSGLRNLIVSKLMSIELRVRADRPDEWRTPGETYSFTSAREGVASSGFAVPLNQVSTALDILKQAFDQQNGAPVVFTCRYAQKSPAMLGFTRYDPTCVIDIDGVDAKATRKLIELAGDRLEAAGMPFALHWGKMGTNTKKRVRNAFGGNVDRWNTVRKNLFSSAAEKDAFSSDLLDQLGLNG